MADKAEERKELSELRRKEAMDECSRGETEEAILLLQV